MHFPRISHCFPMTRHRSILRQGKHWKYSLLLPKYAAPAPVCQMHSPCCSCCCLSCTHTHTHPERWDGILLGNSTRGRGFCCLYAWQHLQLGNIEISNRRHSYKRVNGRVSAIHTHSHSHSYEYTQIIIKNIILRHLRGNVCRNFNEFAPTTTRTTTVAATKWHTRNADERTEERTYGRTDKRVRALAALGKLAIKTHFVENAIF